MWIKPYLFLIRSEFRGVFIPSSGYRSDFSELSEELHVELNLLHGCQEGWISCGEIAPLCFTLPNRQRQHNQQKKVNSDLNVLFEFIQKKLNTFFNEHYPEENLNRSL